MWRETQKYKGKDGIEFLLNNFYTVFSQNSDDDVAWMTTCLGYAEKFGDQQLIGRSHFALGINWYLSGNYPKCLTHYQTALEIFESINDKSNIGRTCNELSVYSRKQKQFQQGLEYLDRSFEICTSCKDSGSAETSLNNKAVV